jgi:hypothetical protein
VLLLYFDASDNVLEDGGMFYREFGQYFAIEANLMLFQEMLELGVANPLGADSRINAGLPQRAEGALFLAAIAVGMLASFDDGFFRQLKHPASAATKAFSAFEPLFVARSFSNTPGSSRHSYPLGSN